MVFVYFLALSGALLSTVLFPRVHLFTFAPFLALLVIRKPLLPTLWMAALAGLTYDLLSSQMRFGLYSALFVVIVLAVWRLRNIFFEEKPLALALFSTLIALIFTLGEAILLTFFGTPPPFTAKSLSQDLLTGPLLDGIFSFFWFSLPLKVYTFLKRGNLRRLLKRYD